MMYADMGRRITQGYHRGTETQRRKRMADPIQVCPVSIDLLTTALVIPSSQLLRCREDSFRAFFGQAAVPVVILFLAPVMDVYGVAVGITEEERAAGHVVG